MREAAGTGSGSGFELEMRARSADFYEDEVDASIQVLRRVTLSQARSSRMPSVNSGAPAFAGCRTYGTGLPRIDAKTDSRDSTDRNDRRRLHELQHSSRELASGSDLRYARTTIRERVVRHMRMRRHCIPQQYPVFDSELSEHAVDDRGRGLGPALWSERSPLIRLTPCVERSLARERDPRPAHASKARSLADGDDLGRERAYRSSGEDLHDVEPLRPGRRAPGTSSRKRLNVRPMSREARSATSRSKSSMC